MRSLPLIRSLKAAVMLSLLMVLPLFMMNMEPLAPVSLLVMCVALMPALLSMTAIWAGLLPALVGMGSVLAMTYLSFGMDAGLLMSLYMVPAFLTLILCVQRGVPFFHMALALAAAELLGGFAALLIMNQRADGQLASSLTESFIGMIRDSGQQDDLLIMMFQSGLARLDSSLYSQAQSITGGLTNFGREELLLTVRANLTDILSQLPAMLISLSIWHSLAGPGIGIYFGRRAVIRQVVDTRRRELMARVLEQRRIQLENGQVPDPVRLEGREQMMRELSGDCEQALGGFPTLNMPPFSYWHLPRKVGLMAALPGLGYLAAIMSENPQVQQVGRMLGAICIALYTIQGLASLDFALGRSGRSLALRCALLGVTGLLFSRVYLLLGFIDQLMNFRKLRPALGATDGENGR